VLGQLIGAIAVAMLVPLGYALYVGDALGPIAVPLAITGATSLMLMLLTGRPTRDLSQREALLLTVAAWLALAFFGCLPFMFTPHFNGFTDCFFESVSGFTTTGATVLPRVEVLSPSVQLWRCFTHWLGGLGIIVLALAVLPLVGHGGMQLYRAEFSGARSEKLKPRVAETARALWIVYVGLTVVEIAALKAAGMSYFEAACHTFGTLGTGGFSTNTASIGGFHNPTIEWIIILFMLFGGISFIQHFRLWIGRDPWPVFRDLELRGYLAIILAVSAVISVDLVWRSGYELERAVRGATFQVVSMITTTGFVTEDFELWSPLCHVLLLALMFVGGCTGSTSGGLKVARVMLLGRLVDREFKRMVEPRGVFAVRFSGVVMTERSIQSLLNLLYVVLAVYFLACVLLSAIGLDLVTSISAVAATMFNVGPGLGAVGPMDHYGGLPVAAKWVLSGCMLAGRLEFYTVLVLLTPAFWRR
jgi:trk system potassium uptake protein TrkH